MTSMGIKYTDHRWRVAERCNGTDGDDAKLEIRICGVGICIFSRHKRRILRHRPNMYITYTIYGYTVSYLYI